MLQNFFVFPDFGDILDFLKKKKRVKYKEASDAKAGLTM